MRIENINKADGTDKDYYLLVIDKEGAISFANTYLIRNFGLDYSRLLKQSFFDLLEPKFCKKFKETISRVEKSSAPASLELSSKNGSMHWINWEVNQLKNEKGITDKYFCVGYDIIGKNQVKKMRQITGKNYEAIVEGLNTGIILQDTRGEVLAANQKAAEIFNTSIETIYESNEFKNLWLTTQDETGPLSFEKSPPLKALQTGAVQSNVSITFKTHTGELKSLLINSQPLFEETNSVPTSVVSSFIDISQEKKLEEDVRQRDALFSAFMNNTPNLTWIVNEDARLVYANRSLNKYLALDKNDLDKNILDLVPKIFADALHKKHLLVLETGLPQKTQEKMFLADGTEIVFWINLFPVSGTGDKKLIGGEAINITNRVKAEQQLQAVNERLHHLSRITTDAVWEWDMHSGHIFRNEVLQELIGYSKDATQGLGWWLRRIHPEDRKRVNKTIKEVIENKGQHWESEYRFKKITGEYIIVYDRGYIIYDNGLPVKMIGSLHDITQVKELEASLVQEKIQRQKAITETIFTVQEKERTRIGHELHDNVNQILGTSKMFMDIIKTATPEDAELKEKVKEYILAAIEEIRKLSKEMVTPQLKENGLIASINTLVDDLRATKAMNVLFYHQDDIEMISVGKKVAIFRIVQEQVKNTLKYSRAKNMNITLQMKKDNVQLMVEDDGVGFDPKQTRRGIGLSNIYERTRFYNGAVKIKTSLGQGCKMVIDIPIFE